MEESVSLLERDHSLCVVLPEGLKKNITVHGSKPVMDVLVMLCVSYRLNLPDYTVEFLSPNKNNISFKPNSPIGSLEAEQIVLKPKGTEEKMKKPYMPEATVRLLINYNTSHKTVVRVNPRLPLEILLPAVCDKCEFNVETTVLLRDSQSKEPLDLTKSLNDYGLREVFAEDTALKDTTDYQPRAAETAVTPTEVISLPPLQDLPRKEKKHKNRGFFSLFRRRKHESHGTVSAPVSPGLSSRVGVGVNSVSVSSTNPLPAEMPKKKRAPPPPVGVSQSVPNNLSSCHVKGAQRSAESTLRSTKRRAPPPPCVNTQEEQSSHTDVRESLNTVEELNEADESHSVGLSPSSSSSPHLSQAQPSLSSRPSLTRLHQVPDPFMPSLRGKDLTDARSALARVLTSSVSKGTLVTRLKNSAAFSSFHLSSCVSVTSQCPDDRHFCAEHESVLKSDLPTEIEWEDPVQKRGLTTFTVVPPNKTIPCDSEHSMAVPDQDQVSPVPEVPPEAENNETEGTEGDPCSPGRSESRTRSLSPELPASLPPLCDLDDQNSSDTTEEQKEEAEIKSEVVPAAASDCSEGETTSDDHINSEDQREFLQSPSADMELSGSSTDEKAAEDILEEEEDVSFPPPPPPVVFKEDMEVAETEKEASTNSILPSLHLADSTLNGHSTAFGEAQNQASVGLSRFAQAVATAVRRSRLQSSEPQASSSPHGRLPSPPRSTYQYGA
ncbi:cordon-bleu protein-like 1 [Kryptolebias marmoratus]|uniref:Cordon-bleu protein-like 1 n=1 Tax=Kryptolebias marmoratus TaxID=37003 RepID=A0A3Q2ZHX4_KRYMA|nr:cordon-bleu protein-like 1 [Kryptolebias marmoratus]XP_017282284.1 cordon-bleu protein-like 1 [Kryptolebias marmoratus]